MKQLKTWRCYHCDELFHTDEEAKKHFGEKNGRLPACQISVEEFRQLERTLEKAVELVGKLRSASACTENS